MYSRIGETFRIRQSDKNGSNVSCRPTKVSLLISYVIPVCTWIILCKPNPGFWCSFQTSAWTIFFMFLKAHEPISLSDAITCSYRHTLIMMRLCSRGRYTHNYPRLSNYHSNVSKVLNSMYRARDKDRKPFASFGKITFYAPERDRTTHTNRSRTENTW